MHLCRQQVLFLFRGASYIVLSQGLMLRLCFWKIFEKLHVNSMSQQKSDKNLPHKIFFCTSCIFICIQSLWNIRPFIQCTYQKKNESLNSYFSFIFARKGLKWNIEYLCSCDFDQVAIDVCKCPLRVLCRLNWCNQGVSIDLEQWGYHCNVVLCRPILDNRFWNKFECNCCPQKSKIDGK